MAINGSWPNRMSVSKSYRTSSGQATPLMKRSVFARGMRNISAFPRPIRGGSLLLSCTIDEKYPFRHKPRPNSLAQAWQISGRPKAVPSQSSGPAEPGPGGPGLFWLTAQSQALSITRQVLYTQYKHMHYLNETMTPGVGEWRHPEIVHDVIESWGACQYK